MRLRWAKYTRVGGVHACLRMWPQVDVVFGHKALPVVELSCVPVRIILHVGDLDTHRKKSSMLDLLSYTLGNISHKNKRYQLLNSAKRWP